MSNKFLFAILLLVVSYNLTAQEVPIFHTQSMQKFNKQYSVKATAVLENNSNSDPYQFAIKTLRQKSNIRLAVGFNLKARATNSFDNFSTGFSSHVRFGKERFTDFGRSKKWRIFYGLDYLANVSFQSNNKRTNALLSGGVSPFAGLQYRLNKRLVLYTETNYSFVLSTLTRDFSNLSFSSRFQPPISIWVGFELFK